MYCRWSIRVVNVQQSNGPSEAHNWHSFTVQVSLRWLCLHLAIFTLLIVFIIPFHFIVFTPLIRNNSVTFHTLYGNYFPLGNTSFRPGMSGAVAVRLEISWLALDNIMIHSASLIWIFLFVILWVFPAILHFILGGTTWDKDVWDKDVVLELVSSIQ